MQRCEVFGKTVSHGNRVSHSHRATKRIWRPNLQTMLLTINNEEVRVRVCTKAMKTLKGKNNDQVKKILLKNKETLSPKILNWIERLTSDQKAWGSIPHGYAIFYFELHSKTYLKSNSKIITILLKF